MPGPTGRSVFITSLNAALAPLGVDAFVARAQHAHLSSVWIRAGRGPGIDPNLSHPRLAQLRTGLAAAGIELWGWHVPFCANQAAAHAEAAKVVQWARDHELAGMVLDAERTNDSPRFVGTAAEATTYAREARDGLANEGLGVAFSSHDQPQVHQDLPFRQFLDELHAACPQIYNTSADPLPRMNRSRTGYHPFLDPDFTDRYRPTGNMCTIDDVKFPTVAACLASVAKFCDEVKDSGYPGHSFWCWEQAPDQVWDVLHQHVP